MNFIPVEKETIERGHHFKGDNYETLLKFGDSQLECVKLVGWTHKSSKVCATCFRTTIRNCRMINVRVMERKGDVYLVKV